MSHDPTAPGARAETNTRTDEYADGGDAQQPLPGDAFHDIGPRLAELGEYVNYYLAAKLDSYKAAGRKIGLLAGIGVVGLLALSAFIVTTMVLFCLGVAQALTALFGGHAWAGNLVAAILFLAITAGAIWFGYGKLTKSSREKTKAKYVQRKQQQRAKFGTDVQQRGEKLTAQ